MAAFEAEDTSSILVGATKNNWAWRQLEADSIWSGELCRFETCRPDNKVVYINWLDYPFWERVAAGSSPVTATNIAL